MRSRYCEPSRRAACGEFAPLRVNGCYRGCEHLVAATVSNWGGTAFEAAACALCPQEALDYRQQPQRPVQQGTGQQAQGEEAQGGQVEEAMLAAIMAQPHGAVDGKYSEMAHAVDGLAWEPYHRELCMSTCGSSRPLNRSRESPRGARARPRACVSV